MKPSAQYPWGSAAPESSRGNFHHQNWDATPVDAHPAGASAFGVEDLIGNGWEWTSTRIRSLAWIQAFLVLSRLLGQFFRRQTFRDEGRIAANRCLHAAAIFPQLVPAALPARVRYFPLHGGIDHGIALRECRPQALRAQSLSEFCSDVVMGLSHPGQKELPSKYLYD